jgi:signal transduction histidine kinase
MSSQETYIPKGDLKNIKDEIIHEFHRGSEIISGELKLLAQGIFALNEKIERFRQEIKEELENMTRLIRDAIEIKP